MGLAANIIIVVSVFTLAISVYFGNFYINAGSGYTAKVVCSGVFTSGRSVEEVMDEDLSFIPVAIYSVDKQGNQITAKSLVGYSRTAVYDPDSNSCSLIGANSESLAHTKSINPRTNTDTSVLAVDNSVAGVNYEKLNLILEAAFHEPTVREAGVFRRSRAIVVLYKGKIIGEKYAEGFSPSTRLIGWGLTEALFSSVLGQRVQDGKLSLSQNRLFPQWKDQRANITVSDLVHGSSHLSMSFAEHTEMIYLQDSAADFAAENAKISKSWSPFSGGANILSRLLRNTFGTRAEYWNYVYEFLNSIGMKGAVIDTDSVGDFVASSFGYATAREWATYGQFVLQKGMFDGKQVLPSSWFDSLLVPVEHSPNRRQGGGGWTLNVGSSNNPSERPYPDLPADTILALGEEDTSLTVIPSKDLVVVRLGCTHPSAVWYLSGFVNYLIDNVIP